MKGTFSNNTCTVQTCIHTPVFFSAAHHAVLSFVWLVSRPCAGPQACRFLCKDLVLRALSGRLGSKALGRAGQTGTIQ